jgi:hypothetical protein
LPPGVKVVIPQGCPLVDLGSSPHMLVTII